MRNTQKRHSTMSASSLPNGWSRVKLSDLCFQDRRLVEPGSDSAVHLPYLSLEHIESGTGRILREIGASTNGEGKSTTFAFDSRHVLYGKLRPYLNKVAIPDFAGRCTTELIPLLPREGVSRRYLAWILRRPITVSTAMQEKTGSRMPRANMAHVLALCVMVPHDRAVQDHIADELDQRISAIEKARGALKAQLGLLDLLANRFLEDFPGSVLDANQELQDGHS